MIMDHPLLSIVIASYNSEKHILDCLQSIRREWDSRLEVILVDGASTDSTMQLVEGYSDLISVMVSEPDKGQSDAFNKGFHLARGEYMTWLNSDDVLCLGAIAKVLAYLETTDVEWLTANCLYIADDGSVIRCCQSGGFESFALSFGLLNVFGPSTFFTKHLFLKFGNFLEEFHFCMDTEYWWRLAAEGVRYERIPAYFWALRLHADAKTASAITGEFDARPKRMQEEGGEIRRLYYPQQSDQRRKVGVVLVRLYRIFNGSYLKSIWDTFRMKGKGYTAIEA